MITRDRKRCFDKRQRAQILARAGGYCDICGKVITGPWTAGHIIPHAMGGRTKIDNGRVECPACAKETHATDTTAAAKAERQGGRTGQYARRKRRGGSMIKGGGFGWLSKVFKKKIGGKVVKRD